MIPYIAFLRAINVGGHQIISKEQLVQAFEEAGFTQVRTVIQSGNVLFCTARKDVTKITAAAHQALKATTGHDLTLMVRPLAEIQELVASDPFGDGKAAADTTTYVAFLEKGYQAEGRQKLEKRQTDKDRVLFRETEVIHLVTKPKGDHNRYSTDFVEKDLGVAATVRNWKTVLKIAALAPPS